MNRHDIYRYILSWGLSPSKDTHYNRSVLRDYFRRPEVRSAIDGIWTRTGDLIARKIASIPWILNVFLECGLGYQYVNSMLSTILQEDNAESFKHILSSSPLYTYYTAKLSDNTFYTYVWTYHVPYMKRNCLDYYLQKDGLEIDPDTFLLAIETLSKESFEYILNHPCHSYLLYELKSPYEYILKKIRFRYTYEKCMEDPNIRCNYRVPAYEYAETYISNLRKQKREQLWRCVFWTALLHRRMIDFRERYYAPGGPKYKTAELEFNSLKKLNNLSN